MCKQLGVKRVGDRLIVHLIWLSFYLHRLQREVVRETRLSGKINVRAAIGSPRRPGDMEQEQRTGCFYSELTDNEVETEQVDTT